MYNASPPIIYLFESLGRVSLFITEINILMWDGVSFMKSKGAYLNKLTSSKISSPVPELRIIFLPNIRGRKISVILASNYKERCAKHPELFEFVSI